jgi:hypothetical protein
MLRIESTMAPESTTQQYLVRKREVDDAKEAAKVASEAEEGLTPVCIDWTYRSPRWNERVRKGHFQGIKEVDRTDENPTCLYEGHVEDFNRLTPERLDGQNETKYFREDAEDADEADPAEEARPIMEDEGVLWSEVPHATEEDEPVYVKAVRNGRIVKIRPGDVPVFEDGAILAEAIGPEAFGRYANNTRHIDKCWELERFVVAKKTAFALLAGVPGLRKAGGAGGRREGFARLAVLFSTFALIVAAVLPRPGPP